MVDFVCWEAESSRYRSLLLFAVSPLFFCCCSPLVQLQVIRIFSSWTGGFKKSRSCMTGCKTRFFEIRIKHQGLGHTGPVHVAANFQTTPKE